MKTEAEKIVEAKGTTAKMIMILADVERPPSAERGAERAAAAGGKSSAGPPAVRPVVVVSSAHEAGAEGAVRPPSAVAAAEPCARGYELIKVDGERRYKCAGCKAVRASGEDMKKHLRTCVGGRKKAVDDAEHVVDDAEGSESAESEDEETDAVN